VAADQVTQTGIASYYGSWFEGRPMANGRPFRNDAMTAASRTFGLGSQIRVCTIRYRRCVSLTVTDRGPYVRGRVIDVTRAAARRLGFEHDGIAEVTITGGAHE
jgi:rare lipoprotein A